MVSIKSPLKKDFKQAKIAIKRFNPGVEKPVMINYEY